MNRFILNTVSLTLLCSVAASCNGSEDKAEKAYKAASATFAESSERITKPDTDRQRDQAKIERQNQTMVPITQTLKDTEAGSAETANQPVDAQTEKVTASACDAPELDDIAAVSAAFKGPSVPKKFPSLLPVPVYGQVSAGEAVTLTPSTIIQTQGSDEKLILAANYLQGTLRASTGFSLPINPPAADKAPCIKLEIRELKDGDARVAPEGYSLISGKNGVIIRSPSAHGLFNGVQTLLQLLPPKIYSSTVQTTNWSLPAVNIVDWPRFTYRGTMLDVARTFFTVNEVKRYIDEIALLKINHLHLHLTDDQGWRIVIDEYPALTQMGASAQTGSPSDLKQRWFYTREQYKDIVTHAGSRFITIVPEIEGPGHATAAMASIPGLTCDGQKPPATPTTDNGVNTPIYCLGGEANIARTKTYLKTVITSIAALTPGPYIHIGSDETSASAEQMTIYTATAAEAAGAAKKTLMAWNELAKGKIPAGTILAYWAPSSSGHNLNEAESGLKQGARFVLSPASHTYLDFEYGNDPLDWGHSWAGNIDVKKSYDWEPTAFLNRNGKNLLSETDVFGVSSALWTEYARSQTFAAFSGKSTPGFPPMIYAEYMTFPRLASTAELGWSPKVSHSWDAFRVRLGDQGARWEAFGVGYFRSPEVSWTLPSDVFVLDQ